MDIWRFLQDEATESPTMAPTTEADSLLGRDSPVLRTTLRIYGTLFFFLMLLFGKLRKKYPNVYNTRGYVDEIRTHLADDQHGYIDWMYKIFFISDSEMLEECGMDAMCFVRVLEFAVRLSFVGMFNAIWLMPVYGTAGPLVSDPIQKLSVANVPEGSQRFLCTVVAAYITFGFAMYNILKEFEWFIRQRHAFLSKPYARNYAVYVQNVPTEYLTDSKLHEFFTQASAQGVLLEVQLSRQIPNLKKLVAKREALIAQLEHAINIEEVTGETPYMMSLVGEKRSAIEEHYETLNELNQKITAAIEKIEVIQNDKAALTSDSATDEQASLMGSIMVPLKEDPAADISVIPSEIDAQSEEEPSHSSSGLDALKSGTKMFTKNVTTLTKNVASVVPAQQLVGAATKFLVKEEDGQPLSSGFITFKTLRATQAALQMIQYPEPFAMEVLEAPEPEDIFWENVGRDHKELQIGQLISFGLTATLCLLWTIPMVTINTLSTIEGLRSVDFVDNIIDDFPWVAPVLEQLAPLLIIVAQLVLKMVLERLSMFEGPISGAVVQASLFQKLAIFLLIQTFFISAIAGSLIPNLKLMLDDPTLIISTLATTLPGRSTFYVQIMLVDTFLGMAVELLRVVPLAIAAVRRILGPGLTEKERTTPWMGLNPINVPDDFGQAELLGGPVLYFMVYFVYSSTAPITNFFMALCFLLMGAAYRHQIIYIYPIKPDSGGRLWVKFMSLLPNMMIIAQVTLLGMLGLKGSITGPTLMIPLLVITILFNMYIRQKHFAMTEHLPSRDAIKKDNKNAEEGMSHEFLQGLYVQPELREKEAFPENSTMDREINQGGAGDEYGTPQNSVVDEKEDEDIDLASFLYPSTIKTSV